MQDAANTPKGYTEPRLLGLDGERDKVDEMTYLLLAHLLHHIIAFGDARKSNQKRRTDNNDELILSRRVHSDS